MLTSLSRSLRRIFDTAFTKAGHAAAVWAGDSAATAEVCATAKAPGLRLVPSLDEAVKNRDTAITPGAQEPRLAHASVGAAAFVAGAGARIYSLEVFRRERSTRPGPHRPAAPRSPQVA